MIDYTAAWHRHYGLLYFWILSKVKNKERAEDLTSRAFSRAWEFRGQLRNPEKFKPWLYQIAANELRMNWPGRKMLDSLDDPDLKLVDTLAEPGDFTRGVERRQAAEHCTRIAERWLNPKIASTLALYAEGANYRQIARRLRVPLQTIATRLHKARGVLTALA